MAIGGFCLAKKSFTSRFKMTLMEATIFEAFCLNNKKNKKKKKPFTYKIVVFKRTVNQEKYILTFSREN